MSRQTFWALALFVVLGTFWIAWPKRATRDDDDAESTPRTQTVTVDDLNAVRALRVIWDPCESGAPAVYGTLGRELDEDTYRRAVVVAEILMQLGTLQPGRYEYARTPGDDDLAPYIEHGYADLAGARVSFSVTAQHLKLLHNTVASVVDEGGRDIGILINCKRPYGDMTHFPIDMGAILDISPAGPPRADYPRQREFTDEQLTTLYRLHEETQPALQIVLLYAQLSPGSFVQLGEGEPWQPVH
jgi:hypothetical protein